MTERSLILVDSGLRGPVGHHHRTTRDLALAAQRGGYGVYVCTPRDYQPPERERIDGVRFLACLGLGLYDGASTAAAKLEQAPGELLEAIEAVGLAGAAAGSDRLFVFHTATLLQVAIAMRLLEQLPPAVPARVKLILRYEPEREPEPAPALDADFRHRIARLVLLGKLELFAETPPLAQAHGSLLGVPCGWLPHLTDCPAPPRCLQRDSVPTLGWLGEARLTKGFHLLPDLIDALLARSAGPAARFLVQVSTRKAVPEVDAAAERLIELQRCLPDHVEVVSGALGEAGYGACLQRCDALLLPYDPTVYARRGSGLLVDGLVAGKPMLVSAGTWMASMTAYGNGMTWSRVQDLPARLSEFVAALPELGRWAAGHAIHARRQHGTDEVFAALAQHKRYEE